MVRDLTSVLNQAINEYEDVLKLRPDCVEAYINWLALMRKRECLIYQLQTWKRQYL